MIVIISPKKRNAYSHRHSTLQFLVVGLTGKYVDIDLHWKRVGSLIKQTICGWKNVKKKKRSERRRKGFKKRERDSFADDWTGIQAVIQ